ncbi:T-lymphocyte surface antigen Ly-9-like [Sarcophilus harrisii]|uniref:T-lymphocyte surface antigen Ly-9-like n=1 Tax=Sarcophilus harrisii TaxID=9305 RepID=UPI00062BA801|nr:T-lymphocyte surface antigen Ly-9-like [Sarcophilus harrisii]
MGALKNEARSKSYHKVDGVVGGDILFPLNISLEAKIQEIEWRFKSEMLQLLSLGPGSHSFLWYNPLDRYKKRLDAMKDASLIIRNVTLKDSGLYEARIIFISGMFSVWSFALSVYEPLPVPQIRIQSQRLTPLWCNITMDCQVSGSRKAITMTWKSWNPLNQLNLSELSEVSPDSRTLSLSLPMSQSNSLITCLASNPMEQRNTTINLKYICALRDIFASNKTLEESVNVYSYPWKWILLWKGLLLLGILLWILGMRFTVDKKQATKGRTKKLKFNKPRSCQIGKDMSLSDKEQQSPYPILPVSQSLMEKKSTRQPTKILQS